MAEQNTSLAVNSNIPAFLANKPDVVKGLESAESRDFGISNLLIGQAMSPAVSEGKVKQGELYDSMTGEVICGLLADNKTPGVLTGTPLFMFKSWAMDGTQAEGVIDRSDDPNGKLAQLHRQNNRSTDKKRVIDPSLPADKVHNIYMLYNFVFVIDQVGPSRPFIISCRKTSERFGKALLGLIAYRQRDIFAGVYKISCARTNNKQGQSYFVWNFTNNPEGQWVSSEETYNLYSRLHDICKDMFKRGEINVEIPSSSDVEDNIEVPSNM